MWVVRLALRRPYTFVVVALLLMLSAPIVLVRTPADLFPNINIPVISTIWDYSGLDAQQMSDRIVYQIEYPLSTLVDDVEHIESQSLNGIAVIKVFFHPNVDIDKAFAQVTANSESQLAELPTGTKPPVVIIYNASTVPILQLALSGKGLSEQQLFDLGGSFVRTPLVTIPGCAIPRPYGGKERQVQVDLDTNALQSKGLSPLDVVNAISAQNVILPSGTSKIGTFEYAVKINGTPASIAELNQIPIRTVGTNTIYIHDVANVRDGSPPQTNIVQVNGRRASLLTVLKSGNASTLDVISGIKAMLPQIAKRLPPEFEVQPLSDQSLFVRASIDAVIKEATIAACLTGLMILLFLGNWRSTLIIASSIPLSIFTSIVVLSALGQTINIMTLGGLALAVGILVDDVTVEIENINRNLAQGKEVEQAILDGAQQIAVPAFVSTLAICIVFVPMFFLTGVAKFLFVPLAEAVVFAMLASYLLSRTLVPTMAKYLLRGPDAEAGHSLSRNPLVRVRARFEEEFERFRDGYRHMLERCLHRRTIFVTCSLVACVASLALLIPWLGQDFFPTVDSGQFKLHLRARTGTRIEETARLSGLVAQSIRAKIPASEIESIIENIGLPYSGINLSYSNSVPIGPADDDILVSLKKGHRPTEAYVRDLRLRLPQEFPGMTFSFLPADMVSQILNFGLPSPIDVQIAGFDPANRDFAGQLLARLRQVPGLVDLHIQQLFDQPYLNVDVDRTKALQVGFTQRDVANNLLISLSGSFQTTPEFWLDPNTGESYYIAVQTPQYRMQSLQDLENIPVAGPSNARPQILANMASIHRTEGTAVVSHYDIEPLIDIYGSVQGRDLGSVAWEVNRIVEDAKKEAPRGTEVSIRGQIQTMWSSYIGLLEGLAFSVVLVYLLIVVNFQSWLDPFIIISGLPAALAGIVWFLFLTRTPISVPALIGSIMCMGVATANSILVVSFAKEQMLEGRDAIFSAMTAGVMRFRPVIMTALAMIIGMTPMALGLGQGGEQNAPLGRAVIGGLLFATISTLFFVPLLFGFLHGRRNWAVKVAAQPE
jgi:multidrug efflux pump subunit AcrB